MEETSKHGVLGRHQTCSKERIEVLSDTIERDHSSRNTPSMLYPESCSDGNLRRHFRKSFCVTSSFSKDLIDKIFKPICNNIMPTTHLVKSPRRWFRTWAMWSCLSCARQILKCNAKNVYFTGMKASFIAPAGISWKKVKPTEASFNGHWTFSQF